MNPANALGDKKASLLVFTLEAACNEAEGFEDAGRQIYDAIRKLERDIEAHEKKKKALDLQIERGKQAYAEYVESIEVLESSVVFLRLLGVIDSEVKSTARSDPGFNEEEKRREKKKHVEKKPVKKYSRLLKTHNLLLLPSFSARSHIARETLETIKKASAAYKTIKQSTDALALGKKEAGQPRKHMSEIESRFDLYEKKVNCKYAKMSYASFVNTLSLQLMQGIFQEVTNVLSLSEKYRELLNDSAVLVRVQRKNPNNPFNEGICSELEDLKITSQSELERMKRKISNELRPSQHKEDEVVHVSRVIRRRIPFKSGFIVSALPASPCSHTILLTFRVHQRTRRGRVYLFRNLLYIQELVFGWEFTVQRENVYYLKSIGPGQLEMRSLDAPDIVLFSPNHSLAFLKSWAIGQDCSPQIRGYSGGRPEYTRDNWEYLGVVGGTLESVYTALFFEEIDRVLSPPDANQETDQKNPGWPKAITVSRKPCECPGRGSGLGCVVYSETSMLDSSDPEEIAVLIRAKISIIDGFFIIPTVAQIHIRADEGSACSVWIRGEEKDLIRFPLFSFSSRMLLCPFLLASYALDRLRYFSCLCIIRSIYRRHVQSLRRPSQQDRTAPGKFRYAIYFAGLVVLAALLVRFQGHSWDAYAET